VKCEIRKELRYALRSGRILIVFAGFMFFALLTPIMLKVVLPQVLKNQLVSGTVQNIEGIIGMTQVGCIQSYMGDVFEMGTILIAFALCGLTASEVRGSTWVLPLCAGKKFGHMLGAKLIVFGALMVMVPILAMLADYGYSGLLFGFEVGISPVLYAGLLQGIYMLFLLSCLLLWGVMMKKPIPAGFSTLVTAYGIHFISSLVGAQTWTPSGLLAEAQKLEPVFTPSLVVPLAVTLLLVVLMMALTLLRLQRMEWNVRNA